MRSASLAKTAVLYIFTRQYNPFAVLPAPRVLRFQCVQLVQLAAALQHLMVPLPVKIGDGLLSCRRGEQQPTLF